jgi:hypothetical protein
LRLGGYNRSVDLSQLDHIADEEHHQLIKVASIESSLD